MTLRSGLFDLMRGYGNPQRGKLARWKAEADRIVRIADGLHALSDDELRTRSRELGWRAQAGEPMRRLLPDAYALVRDASRRTIGLEHYPVQIMGGIVLFEEGIAEMQTGEGKTLTAVLPAYLRGLCGEGCHIVTVNDYLAQRDADTMGPIYKMLGMSVGCIQTPMDDGLRKNQYAEDITYGTAKEIGFDFLRSRLSRGADVTGQSYGGGSNGESGSVQRGYHFALVDEADSIIIDEARTPLIIGLNQPNEPAEVSLFRWCDRVIHDLKPNRDFVFEPKRRSVYLTDAGCRRVVLTSKPVLIDSIDAERIYKHVELALMARYIFSRDRDYVIQNDEIAIVDESTGRIMEGRKWQDGLHHAIEAKERMPITAATATAARITIQSLFRHYTHIAGMTGTARQSRREIKKTYRLQVNEIPTHRPCIRDGLPTRIFATMDAKRRAIVTEIEKLKAVRRSVLVGTPSVSASDALSTMLSAHAVPHQTLNARLHEQEAEIISKAGKAGKVTIATNMAGRGTDIILCDELRDAGGLHVIATEMHSSGRIDRQLVGRAARQGDAGSYQFFLSFEDELLSCYGEKVLNRVRQKLSPDKQGEVSADWQWFFKKAQRTLERLHRKQRRDLLKHEKQQNELYGKIGLDPFLELTG